MLDFLPNMAKADQGPPLNLANPLEETTRQRRLMAAYLSRGLSRRGMADKLDVAYSTLRAWDLGLHTMPIDVFFRACAIVGYSAAEITNGRADTHELASEPTLDADSDIRAVFDELNTPPYIRAQFAEHMSSPAGRYQTVTRSYLAGFVAACQHARGLGSAEQMARAVERAVNEQVDTALVQAGHAPVTDAELNGLIRRLVAARRKAQR